MRAFCATESISRVCARDLYYHSRARAMARAICISRAMRMARDRASSRIPRAHLAQRRRVRVHAIRIVKSNQILCEGSSMHGVKDRDEQTGYFGVSNEVIAVRVRGESPHAREKRSEERKEGKKTRRREIYTVVSSLGLRVYHR